MMFILWRVNKPRTSWSSPQTSIVVYVPLPRTVQDNVEYDQTKEEMDTTVPHDQLC